MAEYKFKFSAEELKNSTVVKDGQQTLVGKSDCPSGGMPYQQLMTAKMAALIKNRQRYFKFTAGKVNSGLVNQKLYPTCTHEKETQKGVLTFSFESFEKDKQLNVDWKVRCQKCVGVHSILFPLVTELNIWKTALVLKKGTDDYALLANSVAAVKEYIRDIENIIQDNQHGGNVAEKAIQSEMEATEELAMSPQKSPDFIDDSPEILDSPKDDLAAGLNALELTPPNSMPQFDPSNIAFI